MAMDIRLSKIFDIKMNYLLKKQILAVFQILLLANQTVSSPVWMPQFLSGGQGRNIRHLPCLSRRTGEQGICMFAYTCMKANGTHLGTCIDRFYFGSCCKLEENDLLAESDLNYPLISDNKINKIPNFGNEDFSTSSSLTQIINSQTQKIPSANTEALLKEETTVKNTIEGSASSVHILQSNDKTTEIFYVPISSSSQPTKSNNESQTENVSVQSGATVETHSSTTQSYFLSTFQVVHDSSSVITTEPSKVTPTINNISSIVISTWTPPQVDNNTTIKPDNTSKQSNDTIFTPVTLVTIKTPSSSSTTKSTTTTTTRPTTTKPTTTTTTKRPIKPVRVTTTTRKPTTKKPTQKPVIKPVTTPKPKPTPTKKPSPPIKKPTSTVKPTTSAKPATTTTTKTTTTSSTTAKTTIKPVTTTSTTTTTIKPIQKTTTLRPTTIKQTTTIKPVTSQSNIYQPVSTVKPSGSVPVTTNQVNATSRPITTSKPLPTSSTYKPVLITGPGLTTFSYVSEDVKTTSAKPTVTEQPQLTTIISNEISSNAPSIPISPSVSETEEENTNVIAEKPISILSSTESADVNTSSTTVVSLLSTTSEDNSTRDPWIEINQSTTESGSSTSTPTSTIITTTPANISHVFDKYNTTDYKQVCGRRMFPESRVVGGEKSTFGKWPWQISLRQWRTSTYLHKCGAALLSENWAITAAHCVENVPPSDLLLRLGEHDLSTEEEPYGFQERRVQIVASHPQFDPRTFEYDLALLRFYEPVKFQPNIVPICVPEDDTNFVGRTAFVTGWGRLYEDGPLPSVLQEVSVPVINNTLCENMYRAAGYIEHIPEIFICAGWKKGGFDSCEGDSGGPMVIQRPDKRWLLAGVISWGIGCAEPNQPGVYTRISEFRDWIHQILQF